MVKVSSCRCSGDVQELRDTGPERKWEIGEPFIDLLRSPCLAMPRLAAPRPACRAPPVHAAPREARPGLACRALPCRATPRHALPAMRCRSELGDSKPSLRRCRWLG